MLYQERVIKRGVVSGGGEGKYELGTPDMSAMRGKIFAYERKGIGKKNDRF